MLIPQEDPLVQAARRETNCRGCGNEKSLGMIVCWTCFKYRDDVIPYKYFDGTLQDWLDLAKKER